MRCYFVVISFNMIFHNAKQAEVEVQHRVIPNIPIFPSVFRSSSLDNTSFVFGSSSS
jgi:hypothetical protein